MPNNGKWLFKLINGSMCPIKIRLSGCIIKIWIECVAVIKFQSSDNVGVSTKSHINSMFFWLVESMSFGPASSLHIHVCLQLKSSEWKTKILDNLWPAKSDSNNNNSTNEQKTTKNIFTHTCGLWLWMGCCILGTDLWRKRFREFAE